MKSIFYPSLSRRRSVVPLLYLLLLFLLPGMAKAQTYCTMSYPSGCYNWGTTATTIGSFTHSPSCGTWNYLSETITLAPGVPANVALNSLGWCGVGIAADFNNDGDFIDAGEALFLPAYVAQSPYTYTGTITVPATVATGTYRLRVWNRLANASGTNGGDDPCAGGFGYGRYQDYTLVVANPCSGTPNGGTAQSSIATVCPTIPFTLSVNGNSVGPGITYQWQSSPAGMNTYTNIAGATGTTYTTSLTASTDYRCEINCTISNQTANSTVASVALNTNAQSCYCIPTSTYGTSYYITGFTTTGGTTNISNTGTGNGSYHDYSATMSASALLGSTVNFTLNTNSSYCVRTIYIDWNRDGGFDEVTEKAYTSQYPALSGTTINGSFMVPWTASVGTTRMRVRTAYYSNTMNACNNLTYGEAEDYTFEMLPVSGICVNPVNLNATAITFNSASLNYSAPPAGNTPTNYIYELRLDGTAPGSGTSGLTASGTTTNTSTSFNNLYQGTSYTFYVRTFCSVGDTSSWASLTFSTNTDTLTPVPLDGFNFDVVANGIGNASASTTNDVDGAGYALVAADFQATSSSNFPTQSIPMSRVFQNTFRKYRMSSYDANNSLRMPGTSNGTVKFLAPKRANKVYVMGVSGSGASTHTATVHFHDGTTQTATQGFPDWYASGNNVASTVGRVQVSNNNLGTGGPYLHDSAITILTANRDKQIDSISFAHTGAVMNVLAVSIVPNNKQSCALPGMPTASNVTCAGGTLTWMGNGVNTDYQVSYGQSGYYADNGTIVSVSGNTGQNTYTFPGMGSNVYYQLYVRTNCGNGSYSDWVGPVDVEIPNIVITPTFTITQTLCSGATAPTLPGTSNNNITGTWSPATVSNTTSGTYTFTPDPGQCAISTTHSISVSGLITPDFTAIAPICDGSTAPTLPTTSNNGIDGTWSPATVSNTTSGTYTFTPTNTNNCTINATMDITVLPTSTYTDELDICSADLPYTWNGISVPAGGQAVATYVTASANGCDSTVTLNLNVTSSSDPNISISVNPTGIVIIGTPTTFTAQLQDGGANPQITWRKNDIDIPGANGMTWTGVAGTDFYHGDEISAYADNFDACASAPIVYSNEIMMYINPTGIKNVPNRESFKLYPNPTHHLLRIEGLLKGDQYSVYDALGRALTEGQVSENDQTLEIDMSAYAQGMYLIRFNGKDGQTWQRKVNKL